MPAAGWPLETEDDILSVALASLTEHDIPPDDEAWAVPDPDCGRPAELASLDGAELDELLAATAPAQPSGGPESAWPTGLAAPWPGPEPETWPAGFLPPDEAGGRTGFAQGGVLDVLAPGVPLAGFADAAHARLGTLTDDELIGVLRAWRRQTSWAQARELGAIAELARRRPADHTPPAPPGQFPVQPSEFVADEVGLALTLTRCAAGRQLGLALDLADRPATTAALEAGLIDLPRARIIVEGVIGLTDAHAAAIEADVLPEAPGMTTGQLRNAVARAVLAADPDASRQRREEELQDARVECWANPAGTANLAGRNLPSAETLAADKRLSQIAAIWKRQVAAAWKQADLDGGQSRPAVGLDLLRARAYLALLLGQPAAVPPADLLPPAHIPAPGGNSVSDGSQIPHGLRPPDRAPAPGALVPSGTTGLRDALPPLAGSICLTLPLTTLLDLSDAPGEVVGYGPVDPDTARALARAAGGEHATAGWHLVITDPDGRALGYGYAPRAKPARGRDGGGWTVTLTTDRIARGQSP